MANILASKLVVSESKRIVTMVVECADFIQADGKIISMLNVQLLQAHL